MLTFSQSIIISIISSGLSAAIVGGLFTYFVNKNLDRRQRVMEMRKKIYSDTYEQLSGFFSNATEEERQQTQVSILGLNRQIQLWGSTNVVKEFNKFWDVLDKKNNEQQEDIDQQYTNLIIAMREDLTGEKIDEKEIRRYGKIY